MKIIVVGFGSIGKRHVKVLEEMSHQVTVVSRRDIAFSGHCKSLIEAFKIQIPDYVVVAGKTIEHYSTLEELVHLGFSGKVLFEKPLFGNFRQMIKNSFSFAAVAYNLRFHPLVQKLNYFLKQDGIKIFSASIYVGSYLPNWRKDSEYKQSYSAYKSEGGGVLRDLSHELDLALWLFGNWTHITSEGGHFSNLSIDSDDVFSIIMKTHICPILTIQMNYLDRPPKRNIIINSDQGTITIDLVRNTFEVNSEIEIIECSIDETYFLEHKAVMNEDYNNLCSLEEAQMILETIDTVEQTSLTKKWVIR
jgi:predicted dehydrogenase